MTLVVGINSSPVKKGNCDRLTQVMMETAMEEGCRTRLFRLSEVAVGPCIHCNFCVAKQTPDRYCAIKDDGQQIFRVLETADIILLSSPVYHMRTNAQMAALADRLRVFIFGNLTRGRLRDKIGISAAVAWHRHGGLETTHLSHFYTFFNLDMLAVGCHGSVSPLGASALASRNGEGAFDRDVRIGVDTDRAGLASGRRLVRRAVALSKKQSRPL